MGPQQKWQAVYDEMRQSQPSLNIQGKVKIFNTFVKKPTTATGSRLGWTIATAAGQTKFQSCSTKFPTKEIAYRTALLES